MNRAAMARAFARELLKRVLGAAAPARAEAAALCLAIGFFCALAAPQTLWASPDPHLPEPPTLGRKTFRLGPGGDVPLASPAAWGRPVTARNTIAALASDQALAGAAALPRMALPDLSPPPTELTDGKRLARAADADRAAIAALSETRAPGFDPSLAKRLGYAFPEGRNRLEKDDAAAEKELRCLAEAIYFEARGESVEGQTAVAEVVLNRVESSYWPQTVCGVVNQGADRKTGCQFSYTCDGKPERVKAGPAWRQAEKIARFLMEGAPRRMTGRATHYHADYVEPNWAKTMEKTAVIGRHIFYRRLLRFTVE